MKSSLHDQLIKLTNGRFYFRLPDEKHRKLEGLAYKHGYEVRLVVNNKTELKKIQSLLFDLDIDVGKPYNKGSLFIQPVYGKYQLEKLKKIFKQK